MIKNNKKGFSLIELIVAAGILIVLVAALVPSFTYHKNESRAAKDEIKFESICAAFKTALGEPEVRNEIDKIAGGGNVMIVCDIGGDGVIQFADGYVAGTSRVDLEKTKLWLNSYQSIGATYTMEEQVLVEQYLVFHITPKTSSTTAKCEYEIVKEVP